eukprot:CAMPEP_0168860330 /NCGR_PEP_ID=MMETSP0727-20121128/17309_1 /TAXON_ID=265536 /ORGANISM="Amphiprora sp., Strain CCMP467" /LENGTH=261 /DNA_ID=CAMNT_0008915225 /DNA_START=283 /DNA_END=1068 /DNA_ORIENTATION=-
MTSMMMTMSLPLHQQTATVAAPSPSTSIHPLPLKRVVSLEETAATTAVAAPPHKKQKCRDHNSFVMPQTTTTRRLSRQRQVRFCSQVSMGRAATVSCRSLQLEQDDGTPSQLWYTRQELTQIKLEAKRDAKIAIAGHGGHRERLDRAIFEATSSAWTNLDEAAQPLLQIGSLVGSQRGLERWTSRSHLFSRCVQMLRVKSEVTLAQAQASLNGSGSGSSCDEEAATIAAACQEASAPSVRFAQLLGRVDAALVQRDEGMSS